MLKNLALALFNVLCIVLIVVSAITVSAVGEEDSSLSQGSSETSSAASQTSSSSDSDVSSSTDATSSDNESDSTSSGDGSSDSSDSSELDTSSVDSDSSVESSFDSTSSKNTSSKKPVHSTGGHGNTFISQDVTTGNQSVITSSAAPTVSVDYVESSDDEEHYVARSNSAASEIYKIIWIPIVLIVLCTGGLVTANVMFRKKYPKKAEDSAVRRSKNARGAVRRRK